MKVLKYPALLIFCFAIVSCDQHVAVKTGNDEKNKSVNVDSLNAIFLKGWNNKDSAAIMKTIAGNAVVMNDSLQHTGLIAIANNWISGGVKVISNISTVSAIRDAGGHIAYDGGTYSLDLRPPGGPVLKEKGNYSLVWTKQQNEEWKLTLIHIEDITRLPDIK